MISNKDRSKWFGASDTSMIMGNWNTPTFNKWWLEKLGIAKNDYSSLAMKTGTALEYRILDHLGIKKRDRQIRKWRLRLRVNLDGELHNKIQEVKTHSKDFKVTKSYWQQCQVETFAARKPCEIIAYRLVPEDYHNWFLPIEDDRLSRHPILYNREWIRQSYLPRLKYLAKCLRKGAWPDANKIYSSKRRA